MNDFKLFSKRQNVGIVLAGLGALGVAIAVTIAMVRAADAGFAPDEVSSQVVAQTGAEVKKWYYATDCPVEEDPGTIAHAPCLLSNLQGGESFEVILDQHNEGGIYILVVCATEGRHTQIIHDDEKLGSTLENTQEALRVRARFAGMRGALQREFNARQMAGTLPPGLVDPLELITQGAPCG